MPLSYVTGKLDKPQVVVTIAGRDADDIPVTIRSDEIQSELNVNLNRFIGNVSIIQGEETITAERAVWNDHTNTAELSGDVQIETPDFTILADRAVVNLDLRMAKIYNGKAFFPAQNYYLNGDVLERLGERTIHIENGTATTCDDPNPAWTIHAEKLTVTEGGYATAQGASFTAGGVPVVGMPWFMFPVKNERQTGLLFPYVSSSSRDGYAIGQPFFWATGENHDLTFTPIWRENRGLSTTIEGRYHLKQGQGTWLFTYLNDQDPQYFRYDNGDRRLHETEDRWWLRSQNAWQFGQWEARLDLDLVSDPLYLAEFRDDPDGFYYSQDLFLKALGTNLNEYLDEMRTSTFHLQRTNYDTFFRGSITYNQNLYSEDNVDTIQRLPELRYNVVSKSLPENWFSGLENSPRFSLDASYTYFTSEFDEASFTDETGHRVRLVPEMSWTSSLGDVATLQLNGSLDMTMYSVDGYRFTTSLDEKEYHDSWYGRLAGSLEAEISTTFNRTFDGGPGKAVATRHQITPTASLIYVEAPDSQGDLPFWDFYDRISPRKAVRFGLLNTLTSKTPVLNAKKEVTGHKYFQFLKIGLYSSYELADNTDWLAEEPLARRYNSSGSISYEEGFGPLEVEVEASFNPFFSTRYVSSLNSQTGDFTSHDLSLRATTKRGDSLTLAYEYDAVPTALDGTSASIWDETKEYEEIRADLGLVINSEWRADFSTRYDMEGHRDLETYARLFYQAQCYGIGLLYSRTDEDQSIGVVVDLLGLGSINYDRRGIVPAPVLFYE